MMVLELEQHLLECFNLAILIPDTFKGHLHLIPNLRLLFCVHAQLNSPESFLEQLSGGMEYLSLKEH
jgi:hypothetical protein